MRIARELYEEMVAHAREDAPNECCGMVGVERRPRRGRVPRGERRGQSRCASGSIPRSSSSSTTGSTTPGSSSARSITRTPAPSRGRRRPTSTSPSCGPGVLWIIVGLSGGRGRRADLADRRRQGVGRRAGRGVSDGQADGSGRSALLPGVRTRLSGDGAVLSGLQAAAGPRRRRGVLEKVGERHERARKIKPQLTEGRLVRVAGARNQAEAEFIQGLLLEEGVPSMLRRSAGFDVPDFLAAGPRDVLVPEAAVATAREVLLQGELISDEPTGAGRRSRRLLAGLLIALALGALLVWLLSQALSSGGGGQPGEVRAPGLLGARRRAAAERLAQRAPRPVRMQPAGRARPRPARRARAPAGRSPCRPAAARRARRAGRPDAVPRAGGARWPAGRGRSGRRTSAPRPRAATPSAARTGTGAG